jgi:hypothetical protein
MRLNPLYPSWTRSHWSMHPETCKVMHHQTNLESQGTTDSLNYAQDLLWFGYKVPPQKGSDVENLVSCWLCDMDRWLDHEGSDLINGLIHWWIYNWMDNWEVVAWLEEVGHQGVPLKVVSYLQTLLLLLSAPWLPWSEQLLSAMP